MSRRILIACMVSLQLLGAVALGQPFRVPGYTDTTYRGTYPSPALPDVEKLLASTQTTRKSVAWFYVTIDGELLSAPYARALEMEKIANNMRPDGSFGNGALAVGRLFYPCLAPNAWGGSEILRPL